MSSVVSVTSVITGFLVLISLVQPAAERLQLPYTVLLAVIGVAVGALSSFLFYTPLTSLFDAIVAPVVTLPISASLFLVVFLPLLLFHAALTIDLREIAEDAAPILTLAILAVFAAAAAVGYGLSFAGVPLTVGLLLGAIVATTDPAAVVAIFRELGAPPRLTRLLEGESLLNDAAAIALFAILVETLGGGDHASPVDGALRFAQSFLGGLILGAVAGRLFGAVLPLLRGLRLAEVTLSIALPYIVYLLGEDVFDVSGVVAVASSGLTAGALCRVRLRPANWRYLERVWEQTGFWASSLIFLIASTLVPKLLDTIQPRDLLLLAIAIMAAMLSRAAVLFGVLPLLAALRLSQRVSAAYNLAITWGGLRGAVTLALALAVTENPRIPVPIQNFVAVLATGFVLFTLLVNGLSLRPVIRLLQLDRLSPLDLAVRSKVLALSLADMRDSTRDAARDYRIEPAAAQAVDRHFAARIGELDSEADLSHAISDTNRVRIGLVALANRERRLILDHREQSTVSGVVIERLFRNASRLLDAARAEDLVGYERAAGALLGFSRGFRIAHFLHRRLRIDGPLQHAVAIRFETLLTRRLVLDELAQFAHRRLSPLLGRDLAQRLAEVVAGRAAATARALEALRLQYPEHADALERRFLLQSGGQLLLSRYHDLFEEGLIGGELYRDLQRDSRSALYASARMPPLDLGLKTSELVGAFAMFSSLDEAELTALARLFRPRLLVPEEVVIRKGDRGRDMYFISSGAVEVVLPTERVRLGSGEFFGEMALLSKRPRQADVISLGYGRALMLAAADFRRFLAAYPRARAEIEATAAARAGALGEALRPVAKPRALRR